MFVYDVSPLVSLDNHERWFSVYGVGTGLTVALWSPRNEGELEMSKRGV